MTNTHTIGRNIRQTRLQRKLTLVETAAAIAQADRVDGLDAETLNQIEKGSRRVASHELAEIADILHTTTTALLGRDGQTAAGRLAVRLRELFRLP